MSVIAVENLKKVYDNNTVALNEINFTIEKGEKVVILGHNGSGKSTLFRTMTGFEEATVGTVKIFDDIIEPKNKKKLRATRKKVGMVFQYFGLVNNLTVFQNVLFGALGSVKFAPMAYNIFASEKLRTKTIECLERVGLSHLSLRRADQLSGGQKQRVAIARMLMQDPEVILADEPIASLDPKAGKEVMQLLVNIAEEKNITLIMILHQIPIAKQYGERLITLKNGRVTYDGNVSSLDDDFVAELFNDKTIPEDENNEDSE